MQIRSVLTLVALGFVIATGSVQAHHSFASEFDANKPLKLEGTVVKVEWINPHAWFHIDVKKPDNTIERWMIEAGTPNTLFRHGFTKNSVLPGTVIRVDGYQAKDGSMRANGRDMTLPDGRRLFMGSSGTGAPDDPAKK